MRGFFRFGGSSPEPGELTSRASPSSGSNGADDGTDGHSPYKASPSTDKSKGAVFNFFPFGWTEDASPPKSSESGMSVRKAGGVDDVRDLVYQVHNLQSRQLWRAAIRRHACNRSFSWSKGSMPLVNTLLERTEEHLSSLSEKAAASQAAAQPPEPVPSTARHIPSVISELLRQEDENLEYRLGDNLDKQATVAKMLGQAWMELRRDAEALAKKPPPADITEKLARAAAEALPALVLRCLADLRAGHKTTDESQVGDVATTAPAWDVEERAFLEAIAPSFSRLVLSDASRYNDVAKWNRSVPVVEKDRPAAIPEAGDFDRAADKDDNEQLEELLQVLEPLLVSLGGDALTDAESSCLSVPTTEDGWSPRADPATLPAEAPGGEAHRAEREECSLAELHAAVRKLTLENEAMRRDLRAEDLASRLCKGQAEQRQSHQAGLVEELQKVKEALRTAEAEAAELRERDRRIRPEVRRLRGERRDANLSLTNEYQKVLALREELAQCRLGNSRLSAELGAAAGDGKTLLSSASLSELVPPSEPQLEPLTEAQLEPLIDALRHELADVYQSFAQRLGRANMVAEIRRKCEGIEAENNELRKRAAHLLPPRYGSALAPVSGSSLVTTAATSDAWASGYPQGSSVVASAGPSTGASLQASAASPTSLSLLQAAPPSPQCLCQSPPPLGQAAASPGPVYAVMQDGRQVDLTTKARQQALEIASLQDRLSTLRGQRARAPAVQLVRPAPDDLCLPWAAPLARDPA